MYGFKGFSFYPVPGEIVLLAQAGHGGPHNVFHKHGILVCPFRDILLVPVS